MDHVTQNTTAPGTVGYVPSFVFILREQDVNGQPNGLYDTWAIRYMGYTTHGLYDTWAM